MQGEELLQTFYTFFRTWLFLRFWTKIFNVLLYTFRLFLWMQISGLLTPLAIMMQGSVLVTCVKQSITKEKGFKSDEIHISLQLQWTYGGKHPKMLHDLNTRKETQKTLTRWLTIISEIQSKLIVTLNTRDLHFAAMVFIVNVKHSNVHCTNFETKFKRSYTTYTYMPLSPPTLATRLY